MTAMFDVVDRHDDRLLVSPEEAGRRLSISRSAIYELLAAGELHSVRIGRLRRIPVAALERYIERLQAENGDQAGDGGTR